MPTNWFARSASSRLTAEPARTPPASRAFLPDTRRPQRSPRRPIDNGADRTTDNELRACQLDAGGAVLDIRREVDASGDRVPRAQLDLEEHARRVDLPDDAVDAAAVCGNP